MAKDEPDALSHELWCRREPRPAAPYFKQPIEAKDHAFDRERGGAIPASWLKSHARSLVRYHLHPETKLQGGDFDQRGPLKRRHIFALAHQSMGKEADNIEENEFIGEDADPPHYGVDPQRNLETCVEQASVRRTKRAKPQSALILAGHGSLCVFMAARSK